VLGRARSILRGHEFHYASIIDAGSDTPFASVSDAAGTLLGPDGGRRGVVSGSFFHAIAQA
jgi:cobyrinic acid a,c-diamide synthase